MRRLRHRLHPTYQTSLRFTQLDHLSAGNNRLNAAAAQTVYRQRRTIERNARLQGHMPGAINRISRSLQRVPDNGVIDFFSADTGVLECTTRGDRSEVDCRNVFECADVLAHRRALTAENENILSHYYIPLNPKLCLSPKLETLTDALWASQFGVADTDCFLKLRTAS